MHNVQIGGAVVRRRISQGPSAPPLQPGDILTAAEVMAMPVANRRAMIEQRKIEVFYTGPGSSSAGTGERHLVSVGKGQYHVVEGHLVTTEPVSRAEAQAIASGNAAAATKVEDEDEL